MPKKNRKEEPASDGLAIVRAAWSRLPRKSWRRLNAAMSAILFAAVRGGARFHEDDFITICAETNAGRWIGEAWEHLYALACGGERGTDNPSAAIAIEKHRKRPAWLWPQTRTPSRLFVGAEILWEGERLSVTSLAADSLVACQHMNRQVVRRVRITREAMEEVRKAADDLRKSLEKPIREAADAETLLAAMAAVKPRARELRHFDIEILREAYEKRDEEMGRAASRQVNAEYEARRARERAEEPLAIEHWRGGDASYENRYFHRVACRVKDGHVETTTGHRATVAGVRKLLPFVFKHRKGWQPKDAAEPLKLDGSFPLHSISVQGVTVGCTLVPWPEVEKVREMLARPNP